jgi:hypothetical protein
MKQVVSIDQLAPGARLAENSCDASGAILLAKGSEINERLISILRRKNIAEVTITVERTPAEQAVFSAELKGTLDRRFQLVAGHPLMDSLKQMILEYRLGK